jgi:transposase
VICLDTGPAYINACQAGVPQAEQKMLLDRLHIVRHALEALDTVRKREHKRFMSQGDTTLTKSKYLWLHSEENVPQRSGEPKTVRAWTLKGALRPLCSCHSIGWARRFRQRWYFWATHGRLAPMIEVAKPIARHLPNVPTYFKHCVTNAAAKTLNSKIATVQKRACGFCNPDPFKIASCFHCSALNLYPTPVTHMKVG